MTYDEGLLHSAITLLINFIRLLYDLTLNKMQDHTASNFQLETKFCRISFTAIIFCCQYAFNSTLLHRANMHACSIFVCVCCYWCCGSFLAFTFNVYASTVNVWNVAQVMATHLLAYCKSIYLIG